MRFRLCSSIIIAFAGLSSALAGGQATPAPYSTEDHQIRSGDVQISARLYAPKGRNEFPVVVLVSGSGTESVIEAIYTQAVAKAFVKAGIGSFAYDKRGTGKSTGKFTGSDFKTLGGDAAAVIRYARELKKVKGVGVWGISQAGWIIPYALREKPGADFSILVSPAGVNPHEQVAFFLHNQAKSWGLTPADIVKTDAMHQAAAFYYAGRLDYSKAQVEVDRFKGEPWFKKVVTHPYWDEMTPEGQLLKPAELAEAQAKRPGAFEIYLSPSSFEDYAPVYATLIVPTLVIYGSEDQLVPIERSRAVVEPALINSGAPHEIKVFDGADHDIQTPDGHVRQDYLDFMAAWAKAQFDKKR